LHDAGANIYACQMAMEMMDLEEEDLVDFAQVLGAMEFLEIAEDAQVMFV
jgi:peroxiredoxin family protein